MKTFKEIIKAICTELNITYELISNDWIIMLEKDNKTKFIAGYKFDLNNHALGAVLDDKYAMYEALKGKNIKVIEHSLLYGKDDKNSYAKKYNSEEYLENLFNKYNKDVVLKINNGTCGLNVEHLTTLEELKSTYEKMSTKDNSLSLCPYYEIEYESRVIMLANEVQLVYKKERPIVIGDGKKTIKELLCEFNENYFKNYSAENADVILEKGAVYSYDWKFNLSRGARMNETIEGSDLEKIISLAKETSKKLNLGFCSVDIIKTNNEYYVLEINSGVMMKNYISQAKNGYAKAYEIYKNAILKMFEE